MATISVSTASQLTTAMATAKAGDTILLASGNYGAFSTGNDYTSAVTIKSANPDAPATFSSVSLNGATGITFDSINFNYTFKAGDTLDVTPFSVSSSSNIVFKNSVFDGDVASGLSSADNGYAVGRGLAINGSTGITVQDSEFKTWLRGILVDESSNINILNNDIHSIRSDGMDFAQVQKVLIEGNYIHDFRGSPTSEDHADMIQFWTSGTTVATSDITIRNNTLDIGQGSYAQSIFMRNEVVDQGLAGASMYYKNISITNNTISNAHTHGITVGETVGLTVSKNILIAATMNLSDGVNALYAKQFGVSSGIMVPTINLSDDSDNVVVTGNSYSGASWFSGARLSGYANQTDWSVSGNSYYSTQGSIPAGSGATDSGATPTPTPTPEPTPVPTPTPTPTPEPTPVPTPTPTPTPEPTPVPTPTPTPTPEPTPVPTPTTGSLPVLDDYVLNISKLARSAFKDNASVATVGSDKVLRLDGNKDYVDLGRLTAFEKSTKISFEVDYSRDIANGNEARLVWNHSKFGLTLKDDGLIVQIATAREGFKSITVANLGLNDTDEHTIRVIMDEVSNRLQVIVDGKVVLNTTSTDLKFVGAGGYESGWMLGTPWGRYFDGDISDFRIEAKAEYVAGTGTSSPVVVASPTTVTTAVVKPTAFSLFGSSTSTRTAAESDSSVAAQVNETVATDTNDAVNTKLASLLWGTSNKTFAVTDGGALVQASAQNDAPALSGLSALLHAKVAAPTASVVVDTGADRLQVVLRDVAVQQDDDLDAAMSDGGGVILAQFFDSVPDTYVADVAPVVDADLWHQVFDAGHALFA